MREEHLETEAGRRRGHGAGARLLQRADLLAALALIVVLVLQLLGLFFGPAADAVACRDLGGASAAALETAETNAKYPDRSAAVTAAIDGLLVAVNHAGHAPVGLPPDWIWPAAFVKTLRPGESNVMRFGPPEALVADAEVGGVNLSWRVAAGSNVAVKSFEIVRDDAGTPPAVVGTVAGNVFAWRDVGAIAGHDYHYSVQMVADDPDLVASGQSRSAPTPNVAVRAVADTKLELVGFTDAAASVKVSKWRDGAWKSAVFEVKQGGAVGTADGPAGDLSTGRVLDAFSVETAEVESTRSEVVFAANGQVVVETGVVKRVSLTVREPVTKATAVISGGALPPETLTLEKR